MKILTNIRFFSICIITLVVIISTIIIQLNYKINGEYYWGVFNFLDNTIHYIKIENNNIYHYNDRYGKIIIEDIGSVKKISSRRYIIQDKTLQFNFTVTTSTFGLIIDDEDAIKMRIKERPSIGVDLTRKIW